jgi:hypothetical protein
MPGGDPRRPGSHGRRPEGRVPRLSRLRLNVPRVHAHPYALERNAELGARSRRAGRILLASGAEPVVDVQGDDPCDLAPVPERRESADQGGRVGPSRDGRERDVPGAEEAPAADGGEDRPDVGIKAFLAHGRAPEHVGFYTSQHRPEAVREAGECCGAVLRFDRHGEREDPQQPGPPSLALDERE